MQQVSSDANLKKVFSKEIDQYDISDDELRHDPPVPIIPTAPTTTFNLERRQFTFRERYIEPNMGLLFLVGSYFFSSLMVVSTKVLETNPDTETKIKPLQILVVRMAITYIGTLIYMYCYRTTIPYVPFGDPTMRKWLLLRGCMGFFSVFGTYFSLMYISISDSVLITFLEPSLIILLAWLILREHVQKMEFVGCFVSLMGVILIIRPPFLFGTPTSVDTAVESSNPRDRLVATLVALWGAFGMASVYIIIRYIGNRAHAIMNVSYFSLVTLVVSMVGIILIPSMRFQMPHSIKEWFLFLNLGISGFAHQMLLTLGIQKERAGRGSLITYTQLIYALLWDVLLYHHLPNIWSWCGMVLIIGSTLYVVKIKLDEDAAKFERLSQNNESETVTFEMEDLTKDRLTSDSNHR